MRFYGMSFAEARDLPIRAFWKLHEYIDRLRAEEILDWLPAFGTSMGGDGVNQLVSQLQERVGTPWIIETVKAGTADIEKAKRLLGTVLNG